MDRYTARLGGSVSIAEDVSYDELLKSLIEFTLRAAMARASDQSTVEHEELRLKGLSAIELFRNSRAVWTDAALFERELAEARREGIQGVFMERNELDPEVYDKLNGQLRDWWRRAGYESDCLTKCMKRLFTELESDASDRAADAREQFVGEVLGL
jgi:hypothetical protein